MGIDCKKTIDLGGTIDETVLKVRKCPLQPF